VQKRIDQAIARQRATERENARLKTELAQIKQKAAEAPAPKPDSSKFESQEAFLEALAGWKADEAMKAKDAEKAKAESDSEADSEKAAAESLMESGKDKYEDFEEVVMNENLKISPEMLDASLQSEMGHDVLYWFGKHPKEAQRISSIRNPVTVAREVGRIEARISAEPESVKPKPKVSQAPDPINPVKSGTVSDNSLESMNMREYIAKRKQQDASILIG
jgi:type II secretory pathway component PulM